MLTLVSIWQIISSQGLHFCGVTTCHIYNGGGGHLFGPDLPYHSWVPICVVIEENSPISSVAL